MDPDLLYPDPQNLMKPDQVQDPNPVRIQVKQITKLISKHHLNLKKKLLNF